MLLFSDFLLLQSILSDGAVRATMKAVSVTLQSTYQHMVWERTPRVLGCSVGCTEPNTPLASVAGGKSQPDRDLNPKPWTFSATSLSSTKRCPSRWFRTSLVPLGASLRKDSVDTMAWFRMCWYFPNISLAYLRHNRPHPSGYTLINWVATNPSSIAKCKSCNDATAIQCLAHRGGRGGMDKWLTRGCWGCMSLRYRGCQ